MTLHDNISGDGANARNASVYSPPTGEDTE